MGPTASGKTALAVELVQRFPFEIISVDSALVYRGMDIGTSKPDAATQQIAPHRLIDMCEPTEHYSAGRFRTDALSAIEDILAQGKVPLLVGGTGLYFRALSQGLAPMPSGEPALREELQKRLLAEGLPVLCEELARVDPEAAARIHGNDTQRILRALEVYLCSGTPLSEWWRRQSLEAPPYALTKIVVAPHSRQVLHERIERRFDEMLEQGLVEEVENLRRLPGMHADLPSMRAVGYRQVWEYLDDQCDYAEMRRRAIVATRRLAKRQFTWFRQEPETRWMESDTGDFLEQVLKNLRENTII